MEVMNHIAKLGLPCKDRVTGLTGVITGVTFDLYGCVQAIVHPGLDADGKPKDTIWFDIARLEVTSNTPVMQVPNFEFGYVAEGLKGAGERPMVNKF